MPRNQRVWFGDTRIRGTLVLLLPRPFASNRMPTVLHSPDRQIFSRYSLRLILEMKHSDGEKINESTMPSSPFVIGFRITDS